MHNDFVSGLFYAKYKEWKSLQMYADRSRGKCQQVVETLEKHTENKINPFSYLSRG